MLVIQSDSSRKEGPSIPLLHTLGMHQSVAEGAAQCCESDVWGTPAPVSMTACPSRAVLLHKFIKSPAAEMLLLLLTTPQKMADAATESKKEVRSA